MQSIPEALAPLAAYRQFGLYKLVPREGGKLDKLPTDASGSKVVDSHDSRHWLSFDDAATLVRAYGGSPYGVRFTFTESDPFYFFDIDNCLTDAGQWSERAMELMQRFPGAAVEVSASGRGLHIIGTGRPTVPSAQRGKKSSSGDFDLYTEARFIALTATNITGSAATPAHQEQLDYIVAAYLGKKVDTAAAAWTTEPVEQWSGPTDDAELIERALRSKSTAAYFGGAACFEDLWRVDADRLVQFYPSDQGMGYDASKVDAAVAQHLAFWTGKDCARIERLMRSSDLARDKWDGRPEYLQDTILKAVAMQGDVYSERREDTPLSEELGAYKLRGTAGQQALAAEIRERVLVATQDLELRQKLAKLKGPGQSCEFWIDHQGLSGQQLVAILETPAAAPAPQVSVQAAPTVVEGYQMLDVDRQLEFFAGCVYVTEQHAVLTPSGQYLKPEQFNVIYGGYEFQLDATNRKTTTKAFEAFSASRAIRWPKVDSTCFRVGLPTGAIIREGGLSLANSYLPIDIPRKAGNPNPFIDHLRRLLPDSRDQSILLAYMAAVVQHKGTKFKWCPLIQGIQGNGKTLFSECVQYAVGRRYSHMPKASEIAEKFNGWLFDKFFIGVEDIYVAERKREVIEVLKPMITSEWHPFRGMQKTEVMRDNFANFIMNSNHKDAVRKERGDRRFCIFYTAQQDLDDLKRDGLTDTYFKELYDWLRGRGAYEGYGANHGFQIVAEYLNSYPIPDQLNPATHLTRAPVTTSTAEALGEGLGILEQLIVEAIEQAQPGFAGGWVSSVMIQRLFQEHGVGRYEDAKPRKLKGLMESLGYVWHPSLVNGQTTQAAMPDGKRPKLFIQRGSILGNLQTPKEILEHYQAAQMPHGPAAAVLAVK